MATPYNKEAYTWLIEAQEEVLTLSNQSKLLQFEEKYLDAIADNTKLALPPVDSTIGKKVIHWTGNMESHVCRACAKTRLSNTKDAWVVMKKTWERHDPSFTKCTQGVKSTWNFRTDSLIFVNAPANSITYSILEIRNGLFKVMPKLLKGSLESKKVLDLIIAIENTSSRNDLILEDLRRTIPVLLNYGLVESAREDLRKLLKEAYLSG